MQSWMDELAYICFLSHDGKSCGTLWPRCLFIVGQSIILGNFFQNSIVDCIADFSFINMTMWSRAVLRWWQRWVTMSSFFYQFGKMNIWNPSVSCYNGVMVWCNCYGVIKLQGFVEDDSDMLIIYKATLYLCTLCSLYTLQTCSCPDIIPFIWLIIHYYTGKGVYLLYTLPTLWTSVLFITVLAHFFVRPFLS